MVLITIVTGAYKPTYKWRAPHCTYIEKKHFIILHTCLEICSKIELFNSVLQCLCHSYANYATVFSRFAEILGREVSQLKAHGSRWVLIVICFLSISMFLVSPVWSYLPPKRLLYKETATVLLALQNTIIELYQPIKKAQECSQSSNWHRICRLQSLQDIFKKRTKVVCRTTAEPSALTPKF